MKKEERLKTLKDLDNRMYRSKSCQLLMRRLKAEAVKRAKNYLKFMSKEKTNSQIWWFYKGGYEAEVFAHNLTEEDLK